ncbi:hypothetical protein RND71_013350 [Anisodus tanguticus]|uniref:Uncharacterized protein n=1 Tax=Anisodus tanguticus TaxID=243964 RepID=A0AAE1SHP4_9SOLA|nr:hypothetical protein RND71_013350 [Anisodus tanguticus]
MYCCFSPKSSDILKTIRVVHLNGHVEDFDHPISVHELMGKFHKNFVFTHAQLLAAAPKSLKHDTMLEQGHIYYLLPSSLFQSSVSPMDLVPVARKLSYIAKNGAAKDMSKKQQSKNETNLMVESENEVVTSYRIEERSNKSRSWKPLLSTIREWSFNQRSESDLQKSFNQRNESELQDKNSQSIK